MIDLPIEQIIGEKDPVTGAITRDVQSCVLTGRRDAPVVEGIPGTNLFFRLSGRAARAITPQQRAEIARAAKALAKPKRSQRPAPAPAEDMPDGPAPKAEDEEETHEPV